MKLIISIATLAATFASGCTTQLQTRMPAIDPPLPLPISRLSPTSGSIVGVVNDYRTGTLVAGATIIGTLATAENGFMIVSQTDNNGVFLLEQLPPGSYVLSVSFPFTTSERFTVNVEPNTATTSRVGLDLGDSRGLIVRHRLQQQLAARVERDHPNSTVENNYVVDGINTDSL